MFVGDLDGVPVVVGDMDGVSDCDEPVENVDELDAVFVTDDV